MPPVPSRQIHLDFHTSEHIPGVGSQFDKRQWQEALKLGHVNLINIFGKGHHSWAYYPTKAGKMHPTLEFDLLGAQIDGLPRDRRALPGLLHRRLVGQRRGKRTPSGACATRTARSPSRAGILTPRPTTRGPLARGSTSAPAAATWS